jgi:seryl-tRNA synthetase
MIDLNDLRERPTKYQEAADRKNVHVNINDFLKLDTLRRELIPMVEEMRAKKNSVSKKIPTMKGDEKEIALKEMKELASSLKEKEEALMKAEDAWSTMQLRLPMIPLDSTPIGKSDADNKEARKTGKVRTFDFTPKDHVALGMELDMIDVERGVKISGSRSYFLKGDGARLHRAVLSFTIDSLVKKGWTAFATPLMVERRFLMGSGFLPGAEEQIYAIGVQKESGSPIENDGLSLIGTSEVSVMGYHADETLPVSMLPTRYCGISNCFRREAGTYGKDTRGLYRIHQFEKVEQVVLCEANIDHALSLFEEIRMNAEDVLQALELPYRIMDVCTGDMGQGKVKMQDIETWMPSRESYGETHSCSYLGDFQTRRLNIKYVTNDGEKKFAHSLNNTCIASPRILIPIMELYQNSDGTIAVPDVLRPYMGGQSIITRPSL